MAHKTERLHQGFSEIINRLGITAQINRVGSMISVHFCDTPVVDFETAALGNNDSFKAYFHGMLDRGVYLPPSAFESYFLNDALTDEDIAHTLTSFEETLKGF